MLTMERAEEGGGSTFAPLSPCFILPRLCCYYWLMGEVELRWFDCRGWIELLGLCSMDEGGYCFEPEAARPLDTPLPPPGPIMSILLAVSWFPTEP